VSAPTVSVIVTAHNTASYIDECVASIVASTYTDLDIVIVDDGSTDTTAHIIDHWATRDPRLQVAHTTRHGRRAALQLAHQQAIGRLHCWVDSDDRIHPTAIARCVDAIDDAHQLVYTHRQLLNPDSTVRGVDPRNRVAYRTRQLLVDNMIFHLRMFTADLFTASGGVGDFESAIDWDMNLRMTEHTTPRCVPRVLYDYRIRADRMTGRPDQIRNAEIAVRNAIDRRQLPYQLRTTGSGWHLVKPPR
jgi:glycosyltransferase involved in cell wall biosynthesis